MNTSYMGTNVELDIYLCQIDGILHHCASIKNHFIDSHCALIQYITIFLNFTLQDTPF